MKTSNELDFSSPEAFAASLENLRSKIYSRKECEAKNHISECRGTIIKSHSISRKFLKMIADDKMRVYCFDNRLFGLIERNGEAGVVKVGCNQASTYQMFCGHHDNELFLPIEGNNELIPDEHQCLRLMYRALMMEKYLKESQVAFFKAFIRQKDEFRQHGVDMFDWQYYHNMLQGALMAIRDFEGIDANITSDIKSNNLSNLRALRIYFRKKPGFLCAGALHAMSNYNGMYLTALQSSQPISDILSINLLPITGKRSDNGVAILAWRDCGKESDSQEFVDSIHSIPMDKISNTLIHSAFEYVENICMNPSWWDSRPKEVKKIILGLNQTYLQLPTDWHQITVEYDNWHATHAEMWNGQQWENFTFATTQESEA